MTMTTNRRRFSGTLNFPEPVKRGETALRRAGIDWEVTTTDLADLTGAETKGRWHVAVRTDTNEPIGVNGSRHRVIQNTALAELGDAIIQMNDGFAYTGGGSMYDGSKTYLVLKSERVIRFGEGDDEAFQSVLLVNDHDGNSPLQAIGFVGRLWCTNQMNGLLRRRNSHRLVSVSHTLSAEERIAAAKDTLRQLTHEMDDLELEIQRLIEIELSPAMAADIAAPRPEEDADGRALAAWEHRHVGFMAEYERDYNAHVRGTALGAVLAAQAFDEHYSRSTDRDAARVNRIINANFPTMRRVLEAVC